MAAPIRSVSPVVALWAWKWQFTIFWVFNFSGNLFHVLSLDPQDRCLVLVTGFFGDRFVEMAERLGAHVDTIRTEIGEHVAEQQLRQAFERAKSDGTVRN